MFVKPMAKIEDEIKQSKFSDDKQRLIINMVYTANWLLKQANDVMKPYGISSQQYNILRILRGFDDWMAMSDMKSRMLDKSPNATRLADKLVDKGLIERNRSSEDRRVVYVRITKKGTQLLDQMEEDTTDTGSIVDNMKKNITNKEAKMASDVIDKLRG